MRLLATILIITILAATPTLAQGGLQTDINIRPTVLLQAGDYFSIDVRTINKGPMPTKDIAIGARQNALDIDARTTIKTLPAGAAKTTEFLLKIPRCQEPGEYTITIITTHESQVSHRTQDIRIVGGGACEEPQTAMEDTLIDTIYAHEIERGENLLIPIRIKNLNDDATTYDLALTGAETLGTYRIDPSPHFTIQSGGETTRHIMIEGTQQPLGENTAQLLVRANGNEQSIPITIHVKETLTDQRQEQLKQALEVTLILLLAAFIIAGSIIAYKKINQDDEQEQNPNTEVIR